MFSSRIYFAADEVHFASVKSKNKDSIKHLIYSCCVLLSLKAALSCMFTSAKAELYFMVTTH